MFQALSLDALRDKFRNMKRQHLLQGEQFLFFLQKRIRKLKGAELWPLGRSIFGLLGFSGVMRRNDGRSDISISARFSVGDCNRCSSG
jgi:hypothetical protein